MAFGFVQPFRRVVSGIVFALCIQLSLVGQERSGPASPEQILVPFVGCASDGQTGPQEAPKGKNKSVSISSRAVSKLAYYSSFPQGIGVLAPRGWHCFGTYGSGGNSLYVSPQPVDAGSFFSASSKGFTGPAIEIAMHDGGTSGRFEVAKIIARVFPAYGAFVTAIKEDYGILTDGQGALSLAFGPYPKDTLIYKSEAVVEYRTPAQTEGLGTQSSLLKNGSPINGAAIVVGQPPRVLLLSVRLPANLSGLTSAIVRQVENDVATLRP